MSESSAPRAVTEGAVLYEQRGPILLITLNRPDALNAVNPDIADGMSRAVAHLDGDSELRVGVLTGAGRAFCAGMDLKAYSRGENIDKFMTFLVHGSRKPIIAAIEGLAFAGGLEIALSCDIIVAARDAQLGIPETKVGLFAAGGGLMRLSKRVGYSKSMEMAMTGEPISGEEAKSLGLASRAVEKGTAVDEALSIAERIAMNAPLAVVASKQLIQAAGRLTEDEYWTVQESIVTSVFASNDATEGPVAFAEKRRPKWTGT